MPSLSHLTKTLSPVLLASSLLAACGIFGGGDEKKEIIFDTAVGPDTREQVRSLPGGLKSDSENARHSQANPPSDMDPSTR